MLLLLLLANTVHQSKAADPSQKKTDEAKKLQAEAPQPADKPEGEMVSLLRSKVSPVSI